MHCRVPRQSARTSLREFHCFLGEKRGLQPSIAKISKKSSGAGWEHSFAVGTPVHFESIRAGQSGCLRKAETEMTFSRKHAATDVEGNDRRADACAQLSIEPQTQSDLVLRCLISALDLAHLEYNVRDASRGDCDVQRIDAILEIARAIDERLKVIDLGGGATDRIPMPLVPAPLI